MQQVEEAIVGTINEAIKFKIDQRSVVYLTHGYKSFNSKRCVRLLLCWRYKRVLNSQLNAYPHSFVVLYLLINVT